MKSILREVIWSYLFGAYATWLFLFAMTLAFAVDVVFFGSEIAGLFGISNLTTFAVLALGWWMIWLAYMLRRRNERLGKPYQDPDDVWRD